MANLYRLILCALLALFAHPVLADGGPFPASPPGQDTSYCNTTNFPAAGVPGMVAAGGSWSCTPNANGTQRCGWLAPNGYFAGQCSTTLTPPSCPAGANAVTGPGGESLCTCTAGLRPFDGQCVAAPVCPEGQVEQGGACVPVACKPNETRVNGVCVPEPPCPAGQQRVNGVCKPYTCPAGGTASDQWYDLTSASTSSTCLYNSTNGTYCVLTIKPQVIARTNGAVTYMGGYGVYTGGTCGPSEPGKPTPQDPEKPGGDPNDGTKPPGPNDPKPTKPPSGGGQPGGPGGGNPNPDGTCPPGTYKSNGKCYPKDPPKEPPDNDGKCPQGYVKVGSECVPLQPPPDDEEGKDPSQFGGQCAATTCEGDAIQCAIVRDQYRRACELFEKESLESQLYGANKAKEGNQTTNLPGNESISLSGRIDTSNALGGVGGGVRDLNVTVAGQQITLPFSILNEYLEHLGNLLVAVSFLLALRIVSRG